SDTRDAPPSTSQVDPLTIVRNAAAFVPMWLEPLMKEGTSKLSRPGSPNASTITFADGVAVSSTFPRKALRESWKCCPPKLEKVASASARSYPAKSQRRSCGAPPIVNPASQERNFVDSEL